MNGKTNQEPRDGPECDAGVEMGFPQAAENSLREIPQTLYRQLVRTVSL